MGSSISILDANTIEIHYWLNDGSHTMDAYVFNKCEYELLGIIKEKSCWVRMRQPSQRHTLGRRRASVKQWIYKELY